jgi:hypothetical protein
MADYLFYWTTDQLAKAIALGRLPHAGSEQFSRVKRGDRVWIVGRLNGAPELLTVGYIDVASILSAKSAQAEMARRVPGYTIWTASKHILASKDSECRTKRLSLAPLYGHLEFESRGTKTLELTDGHPKPQQLQTMRRLTSVASVVLRSHWREDGKVRRAARAAKRALDLDQLEAYRLTLVRLEQQAARALLLDGRTTATCDFCARVVPASLLVAAHIKPRSSCTESEKRLVEVNVIGLCKLGCDDLFERGYVDVLDGVVVQGGAAPITPAIEKVLDGLTNRRVIGWTEQREAMFRWRRNSRKVETT